MKKAEKTKPSTHIQAPWQGLPFFNKLKEDQESKQIECKHSLLLRCFYLKEKKGIFSTEKIGNGD